MWVVNKPGRTEEEKKRKKKQQQKTITNSSENSPFLIRLSYRGSTVMILSP